MRLKKSLCISTLDRPPLFYDNIRPVRFGSSYLRVFSHGGELYSLDNSGFPRRALDPDNPWEPTDDYYSDPTTIPLLWERHPNRVLQDPIEDLGIERGVLRVRHTAVRVVGDELQVFYTERGTNPSNPAPERVLFSTIDLGVDDWEDWQFSYPGELILEAIPGWEGGQFPVLPSELGSAPEDVNQLRDPGVFEDSDGAFYLIYAGRGEDALGIAQLSGADILVGDMNDDGSVNFMDIPPFISALIDPVNYQEMFNLDPNVSGDLNGDEVISFLDIPGFIEVLINNA